MKNKQTISVSSAGFTLLEVIVFLTIAGIVLPLVIAPFVTAINRSGDPEVVITANFLATQKYEALLGAGYFSLPTASQVENISLNGQTYTRTTTAPVEVSPANLSTLQSGTGIKRIAITVTQAQILPGGLTIIGLITNRM
jgi:type II secretory pathway pseudopilin PulG